MYDDASELKPADFLNPSQQRTAWQQIHNGVEEDDFKGRGKVDVKTIDAHRFVVREVVGAEGRRIRDADGKVGEDGQQTIRQRRLEGKVMRNLVDGEEAVLIGGRADYVGRKEEFKGPEGGGAQEDGAGHLERDDAKDDVFR